MLSYFNYILIASDFYFIRMELNHSDTNKLFCRHYYYSYLKKKLEWGPDPGLFKTIRNSKQN